MARAGAVEPGARHLALQLRHEARRARREVARLVRVGLHVEELGGPARLGPARAATAWPATRVYAVV